MQGQGMQVSSKPPNPDDDDDDDDEISNSLVSKLCCQCWQLLAKE